MTSSPELAELSALIDENFREIREGSVVMCKIMEITKKVVIVDLGHKSEGVIPASEFEDEEIEVGDEVEVLVERLENDEGLIQVSKEKAAHRKNWLKITDVHKEGGLIRGKIKSMVKGGLVVNVGVDAFLPGSQIDIVPSRNMEIYLGKVFEFKILKINDERKNIVLSRREVIEAERAEQRQLFLETVKIGDRVNGLVKNITDFGVFVDLNGMDGLLHITDLSWGRISHPSEVVNLGDEIEVVVTEIDREKERITLGMKQLQKNPWDGIEKNYPIGSKINGKVVKLVPYGAFVQIEEGVEGLIHVSELSWTKRISRPHDVLSLDQDVEAVVLGINIEEQKISLGIRQFQPNPWDDIEERFPINKRVEGEVRNITTYGAFIELEDGIDGMIHVSDLSWTRKVNHPSEILKKGDKIAAAVVDIDKENRHISLSVKALEEDPWMSINEKFKIGDLVKGKVVKIASFGAFVQLQDEIDGLVHISQLSEDHVEKVKDVLKVGDEVEARVIKIDEIDRRVGLSIKATNYDEELLMKEASAFKHMKSNERMVGLDEAFRVAESEEYRPGQSSDSADSKEAEEKEKK